MGDWASTVRQRAAVTMAGGQELSVELHLQAMVPHRMGPETVLDMLNRPDEEFFPVLVDGVTIFLARTQVALVCWERPAGEDDPDHPAGARQGLLRVMLTAGLDVQGYANLELPRTRARALDFLNSGKRFHLLVDGPVSRLLNGVHIRNAHPVD